MSNKCQETQLRHLKIPFSGTETVLMKTSNALSGKCDFTVFVTLLSTICISYRKIVHGTKYFTKSLKCPTILLTKRSAKYYKKQLKDMIFYTSADFGHALDLIVQGISLKD